MDDQDLKTQVLDTLKKLDSRMNRMEYILNKSNNKLSRVLVEKSR